MTPPCECEQQPNEPEPPSGPTSMPIRRPYSPSRHLQESRSFWPPIGKPSITGIFSGPVAFFRPRSKSRSLPLLRRLVTGTPLPSSYLAVCMLGAHSLTSSGPARRLFHLPRASSLSLASAASQARCLPQRPLYAIHPASRGAVGIRRNVSL